MERLKEDCGRHMFFVCHNGTMKERLWKNMEWVNLNKI